MNPIGEKIKFGAVFPFRQVQRVHLLERWGYDSVWSGEHIVYHRPTTDALIVLAAFGARTQAIQLGTSVLLMPLRHPVLTAKSAATLDVMTSGRLLLGVGVGGEYAQEFEAMGVPVRERGSRTDEVMTVMRLLWNSDHVSFQGHHYRISNVTMEPKPAQQSGPPMWVAGRSDAAIRRAGRLGDGYFPYLFSPERYSTSAEQVRAEAERCGRDPESLTFAIYQFTYVGDTYESALDRAVNALGHAYRQDFRGVAERYCVLGPPERCIEQLQRFIGAGARHIVLVPIGASDDDEHLAQLETYARDVLPKLRQAV